MRELRERIGRVFMDPFPSRYDIRPDQTVDSVADIDARSLYERGVRAIGFDVDQTLCPYYGHSIHARLLTAVEAMRVLFEDRVCIISNCGDERRQELIDRFPLYVVPTRKKKPDSSPYRAAEERFAVPPHQWAFAGDRLLTDIVGANRAGWYSIHVRPFAPESDPWYIPPVRSYERLLRRIYRV